ncbi:hypothetical protein GCM10023339_74000 [Alloalcanivorax gelatiniphagus]
MHIDDKPLLLFIASQLGLGKVTSSDKVATYSVVKQDEVKAIINILSNNPLNTTKYLNFLDFKRAFELYINAKNKSSVALISEIDNIVSGMNKSRTDYTLMQNIIFKLTPY